MSAIIEATDLHKHYGEVHALDGLNLTADSGRLTALLGPNGAGKTTFISAVATLLKPTSGSLSVPGTDVAANPKAVRSEEDKAELQSLMRNAYAALVLKKKT